MAETSPLLRDHTVYSGIEGSNPSVSATVPVNVGSAALDWVRPTTLPIICQAFAYILRSDPKLFASVENSSEGPIIDSTVRSADI